MKVLLAESMASHFENLSYKSTEIFWGCYLFRKQHRRKVGMATLLMLFMAFILFPEMVFAVDVTLESQLEAINTLTVDKIKTYGISAASIAGGIWAVFKGSPKLAGIIVGIGVMLGYYLSWVQAGMKI